MFSVTPDAIKDVEGAVKVRKNPYLDKTQCVQNPVDSASAVQTTVCPNIGLSPLYKEEENLEETLNIRPSQDAPVQERIDEFEKRFSEETNYYCSWNTHWRYAFRGLQGLCS